MGELSLNKLIKNYLFLLIVAGTLVLLDQWTKELVRGSLPMGSVWSPWEWLSPYARIVHWHNTGVAFGMFQGMGSVFAVLAAIVSIVIIYLYNRVAGDSWILKWAMSLQLAGAVGNLIDRVTIGYVTDFISVGNFPVFNVADASISIGVVILLIYVWYQERKHKELEKQSEQTDPNPDDTGIAGDPIPGEEQTS